MLTSEINYTYYYISLINITYVISTFYVAAFFPVWTVPTADINSLTTVEWVGGQLLKTKDESQIMIVYLIIRVWFII